MHPFEKESAGLPPGVGAHLDVRLKSGWRFDSRRKALVAPDGKVINLKGRLTSGTKIVPTAPSLCEAKLESLSADEAFLARCVQVVLPCNADPATTANQLRTLDGVEQVSLPPEIGLP